MEFGQSREYSEETAALIDAEVRRILDECYRQALEILGIFCCSASRIGGICRFCGRWCR